MKRPAVRFFLRPQEQAGPTAACPYPINQKGKPREDQGVLHQTNSMADRERAGTYSSDGPADLNSASPGMECGEPDSRASDEGPEAQASSPPILD